MSVHVNGKTPQYDADKYSDFVAEVAEGKCNVQDISNYLESLCTRLCKCTKSNM